MGTALAQVLTALGSALRRGWFVGNGRKARVWPGLRELVEVNLVGVLRPESGFDTGFNPVAAVEVYIMEHSEAQLKERSEVLPDEVWLKNVMR